MRRVGFTLARRPAPSVVLIAGVVIVAALMASALVTPDREMGDLVFFGLAMCYFLVLGVIILSRVPGNRIGWLFSAMALSIGLSGTLEAGIQTWGFAFGAVAGALWMLWIGLVVLLFFWFPTGRPPTRRWRWVEIGLFTVIAVITLSALLAESLCRDGEAGVCFDRVENPIGIAGVPHPEYSEALGAMLILAIVAALVGVVWRYRISARAERLQLKWFLLASALFLVSIGAEVVYESSPGRAAPAWVGVVGLVGVAAIPVAATIAITRYRLYEIDRIISRTVSYALVVGLLASAVAGLAALVGAQFQEPLVVAAATLAVAALFNPLRRRVQVWVDRRFNRSRYDAEQVVEAFTESLRDRVDPSGLVDGWVGVVSETMQPSSVGVWVRK